MPGRSFRFGEMVRGWTLAVLLVLGCTGDGLAVPEEGPVWDEADTVLANRYIQVLVQNPEYGRVLELLWKHYEEHGQSRVLLNYFEEASLPEDALAAKLIHGHLLRRKGNADQALRQYQEVRSRAPDHPAVLMALRDILRSEGKAEEAREHAARLMTVAKRGSDAWAEAGHVLAELHRDLRDVDEAVGVWLELLETRPNDEASRRRVLDAMVAAGRTAEAVDVCRGLAGRTEGEARLEALRELGMLLEVREEAAEVIQVYTDALSGLHFRHYEADGFLTRLIRAHERFGGLDELEARWKEEAGGNRSDEGNLWRMVRFFQLTADPSEEEVWLRKLVARVPSDTTYRQRLAEVCFRNGEVAEAASMAEELSARVRPVPVDLVFLRAEIALREGGPAAASVPVEEFLTQERATPEVLRRILRFAETHSLDGITERLLLDQETGGWGDEGNPVAVRLAAFHRERGQVKEAADTLRRHVAAAEGPERARRTAEAVRTLIDLRMRGEALLLAEEAMRLGQADRALLLLVAELRAGDKDPAPALTALEQAWEVSGSGAEKREVDERLFSLLRARAGEGEGAEPKEEGEIWAELWAYYRSIKGAGAAPDAADATRFRAAWWAVRIGDTDEAYRILPLLHDPGRPVLEYEELLLELAERTDNRALVIRQLELIARLQPEREEEALIRKAEMRLALNFEDEAIRTLRLIVERPGASLKAVQALARAYRQQGRHRALEELWQGAFRKANLLERREILEPYAETLVHLEKIPEALALYREMLGSETDATQRRNWLEAQLGVAERHGQVESWMLPGYRAWAEERPLDPFGAEALGRVLHSLGRAKEAFAAMKKAYYVSGGSAELLPVLGEFAAAAGEESEAIYFQRQLLTRPGAESSPEPWLALIARMEDALDVDGADRVRRELEGRFGQDAAFLRRLAKLHEDRGAGQDALRIWKKVAALRPWEAEAWFESGLLERSLGQTEDAKRSFEAVLRATAGTVATDAFPLFRVATVSEESLSPGTRAAAVAKFPLLGSTERREISDWLAKPRSEFRRSPEDLAGWRLRGIEELAALVGPSPEWQARWKEAGDGDRPGSPADKLWSAVHAGPSLWAAEVVEGTRPESGASAVVRFRYCVLSLRVGNDERLVEWVAGAAQADRRHDLLLGIEFLLRERGGALPADRLARLLRRGGVLAEEARLVMQGLQQDGYAREALWLGEALAVSGTGTSGGPDGDFLFYQDLSDLAAETGDEEARQRWLGEAVAGLDFDWKIRGRVPFLSLHRLVRDAAVLETSGTGSGELRDRIFHRLCEAATLSAREADEARIWMLLALGEADRALREVDQLASKNPGPWLSQEFVDLLIQVRDRSPWTPSWLAWSERLLGEASRGPHPDATRVALLVWALEPLGRARRIGAIREFLAMNPGLEMTLLLLGELERRDLWAESVAVHAALLEAEATSPDAWRGFLAACRAGNACEEALAVLDACLIGLLPMAQGVKVIDVHRHRAAFLEMTGDSAELARWAGLDAPGEFLPEVSATGEEQLIYRRSLARVYRSRGNRQGALACLMPLQDILARDERICLAVDALELGQEDLVTRTMEGLALGPGLSGTEKVVGALAEFHGRRGRSGVSALRDLARQAVRWSLPTELCLDLADRVARSGFPEEADALLVLRGRHEADAGVRARLDRQRVRWRNEPVGAELPLDSGLVVGLARALPSDPVAGADLIEIARKAPAARRSAWSQARDLLSEDPRTRVLAVLLDLGQGVDPLRVVAAVDRSAEAEPSWVLHMAASVMGGQGPSAAAAAVRWMRLARTRRDGNPWDDGGLTLRTLALAGDEAGILEWHGRTARFAGTSARFAALSLHFREIGRPELAQALLEERYRDLVTPTKEDLPFLLTYVRELLAGRRVEVARSVLLRARDIVPGDGEVLDLIGECCRLLPGGMEAELSRFGLRDHERRRVLAASGHAGGENGQNGALEPPTRHSSSSSLGSSLRKREGR